MPMLSVIIPTKNEEMGFPATLNSLARQKFRDYELIVADFDSKDRTREIAKAAGARVVRGGLPSPGRNRGAAVAKGDILLFLDADTKFPDDGFLGAAVSEIKKRKLDVAAPFIKPMSKNILDHLSYSIYNVYVLVMERVWQHAPGFCMFATRRAHEAIKGFDENVVFAEDHDYAQRAVRAGFSFGVLRVPAPVLASTRRFHRDGRVRTAVVYLWTEVRMMIVGPYKRKIPFTYEMGGLPEDKPPEEDKDNR